MASVGSEARDLPAGAYAELGNIALWFQSEAANFQVTNDIEVCTNTNGLAETAEKFLGEFRSEIRPPPSEVRITAIHFNQPTIVPVEEGWSVDLIPVRVVGDVVRVGGQMLWPSRYIHLQREARVSGDFFTILVLSKCAA
ncbi:uncharacterized protein F4822DRAFT_157605 [Hypoxylon trugodes]|uniref:uncharacterized protein n=1 Tax=Hypoxylon trugodes TaxID=326681 RepID=UPI00219418F6|nr:uncharacterized protein F4822DRAFT_157605 [Hypoxylon trugodes]KAI1390661.1 hypothetical protein F4822DRAFT_157605 [Hypoxylon trugodes]